MPGILPMKVIKVGTSSQSRIAQACDRCRSKKIRCDGIRPCCSQCANVGFECRTSDKLSRRAFPRGYTESLEERVRSLETEVRELKDLLDEKDEKIDMLSKMHGNHPKQPRETTASHGSPPTPEAKRDGTPPKEDSFRVQASPLLLGVENSDSYFMGASSGRAFIEAFKRKMQENGKSCSDFNPEAFLHIQGCYPLTAEPLPHKMRAPPRIFSDRCVNVYFQEWAPLFPVLHRPTFLRVYEEFVADPDKMKNNHKLTQLYLVFCIASLSGEQPDLQQVAACESHWQASLDAVLMDNAMNTLQCLVLAMMYCTIRADYKRLQYYKGIAVGLSHRLGLHQSQKRFSFGALTIETRKKVFWTLYTLDCFSAAVLGLPKLLKDDDIHAEYPSDADDEYVTEKGFQPSLPGEHTRLSSALALFRGARILGKVLEKNYPAAASHELSLQQIASLEAELNQWTDSLPQHLRLHFRQDKPATDVTGSRSPILALVHYYIRILIQRPAVGSALGTKAAPALMSICESSKHIIQILELLAERSMCLSICLNKTDVLVLCGIALLYQSVDLKKDSKLVKDNEKLVNTVLRTVEAGRAPGSLDLRRAATLLVNVDEPLLPQNLPTPPGQGPETPGPAPQRLSPLMTSTSHMSASLGRHISASVSESDLLQQQEKLRRMTMPQITPPSRPDAYYIRSRPSFDGLGRDMAMPRRDQRYSLGQGQAPPPIITRLAPPSPMSGRKQSLDYLSLGTSPSPQPPSPTSNRNQHSALPSPMSAQPTHPLFNQLHKRGPGVSTADWEALLGSIEGGRLNVYDAIYGGTTMALPDGISTPTAVPTSAAKCDWVPDSWDMAGFGLAELNTVTSASAQSVLSLSEDSLSSGEELVDLGSSDMGLGSTNLDYQTLSGCGADGSYILDGLAHFGL